MSRSVLTYVCSCPLLSGVTGCDQPPPADTGPNIRPVKSLVVSSPEGSGVRNFPGRVEPSNRADLAFRVGGTLSEVAVQEGTIVNRGQVIARLDQTDFEITLRDRQAT